jgi:citrate lyase subunit beta / citryl-CoA lyase
MLDGELFRASLGLQATPEDRDEVMFAPYRAPLVLASRLAGLAAPIDGVYTVMPTTEELAWARRVIAAAQASSGAASSVDGQMIDAPVILRAERLLRSA